MKNHTIARAAWTITGSLARERRSHTATTLANGKVLIAGGAGKNNTILDSAELYDPQSGTWSQTGNLTVARIAHTATLLSTGNVLVAGGRSAFASVHTAELYDPATGKWTPTGRLTGARNSHTATLLPNGFVLVAGGIGTGDTPDRIASAELYDPVSGKWSATGHLALDNGRESHTATLLNNEVVLIVGGRTFGPFMADGAELYDIAKGIWTPTGAPRALRVSHTATILQTGQVLVAGGVKSNGLTDELDSSELFDPTTEVFADTGGLASARQGHTATLLQNGRVLIAGGLKGVVTGDTITRARLNIAELYDPHQGRWIVTADMNEARSEHTSALLGDGRVLVTGGSQEAAGAPVPLNQAELFRLKAEGTP